MAGRKSDFTLPKFDDIFSTQEMRDDEKLAKILDIPLELIDDFPDHPYKVRDDEDMIQLVESVKERGVITPATVRQKEDGRYELISGHRRKRASELAGCETLRCEVVDLTRDEAIILMVESNFQRSQILPSEKAFAYKMGIDYEEKAFYDILSVVARKYEFEYPDDKMIELSKRIKLIVDDKARYTDWSTRDDIKANLQVDLILLLDEFDYPPVTIDDVYKEVLEQAENFKKYA